MKWNSGKADWPDNPNRSIHIRKRIVIKVGF